MTATSTFEGSLRMIYSRVIWSWSVVAVILNGMMERKRRTCYV